MNLRAGLAILAVMGFAVLPGAGYAQSETTRYDLIGGYVIDLPASAHARFDIPNLARPPRDYLLLMATNASPLDPDHLRWSLMADEAPELDRDFSSLSATNTDDLLKAIAASFGMPPEAVDIAGAPLFFEVGRSAGLVRVDVAFAERENAIAVVVVIRPEASFLVLGSYQPRNTESERLLDVLATVRPSP